jgi:hypothetical protein
MSEQNMRLVRDAYASTGALFASFSDRMAPRAEFDFTAIYPERPVLKGIEALRRFREQGPWEELQYEPSRFLAVDDERTLVLVKVSAIGRGSGVPVEILNAHEWTIHDGLLVRFKVYRDQTEALEAAGLSE